MAEVQILSVDLDDLDLTDEERVLLEACRPEGAVDLGLILTEEKIAEAMMALDLVQVH